MTDPTTTPQLVHLIAGAWLAFTFYLGWRARRKQRDTDEQVSR